MRGKSVEIFKNYNKKGMRDKNEVSFKIFVNLIAK